EVAWRANPDQLLVGLLEVATPERDHATDLTGPPQVVLHPPRAAPLDERVRQLPRPLTAPPPRRDPPLEEAAQPRQRLIAMGLADPDRFVNESLSVIP